jgi:hypothetical protein
VHRAGPTRRAEGPVPKGRHRNRLRRRRRAGCPAGYQRRAALSACSPGSRRRSCRARGVTFVSTGRARSWRRDPLPSRGALAVLPPMRPFAPGLCSAIVEASPPWRRSSSRGVPFAAGVELGDHRLVCVRRRCASSTISSALTLPLRTSGARPGRPARAPSSHTHGPRAAPRAPRPRPMSAAPHTPPVCARSSSDSFSDSAVDLPTNSSRAGPPDRRE